MIHGILAFNTSVEISPYENFFFKDFIIFLISAVAVSQLELYLLTN
jgi:hypothetical protein